MRLRIIWQMSWTAVSNVSNLGQGFWFGESSHVIRQYCKIIIDQTGIWSTYESLFRFFDHNRHIQCRFLNISEFYSCEALSALVCPWFEKAIQVVSGGFETFISGRRLSCVYCFLINWLIFLNLSHLGISFSNISQP